MQKEKNLKYVLKTYLKRCTKKYLKSTQNKKYKKIFEICSKHILKDAKIYLKLT